MFRTELFRSDPFADFDRIFSGSTPTRRAPQLAVDAVQHEDRIELRFDLPGVPVDDIDLTVDQGVLRLAVERSFETGEDDTVLSNERWTGTRARSFRLGDRLDADELESSYDAGVLTVTIPLKATEQPRRIAIAA